MLYMSTSDQIIAVINDLCQKFGIAIDWSKETVMPYIEELCGRYVTYEAYTSMAWCVAAAAVVVIIGIAWIVAKATEYDYMGFVSCCFWVSLCGAFIIWLVQAMDIIACNTIPEKVIIDYLNGLLRMAQNSR